MQLIETNLDRVYTLINDPISDERGSFVRRICMDTLQLNKIKFEVKQVSSSFNKKKGTLRGMHFQTKPYGERKIVTCLRGKIFDVVVDIRKKSSTYLNHYSIILEENDNKSLFIDVGFAHGFQTLDDNTEVMYHIDQSYSPHHSSGVLWNDPMLNISWPLSNPIMSLKDQKWELQ